MLRQWFDALDAQGGKTGRLGMDVLERPLILLGLVSSRDELLYVLSKKQAAEEQRSAALSGRPSSSVSGVVDGGDGGRVRGGEAGVDGVQDEPSVDWLGFLDMLIPAYAKFSHHELSEYAPQVEKLLAMFDEGGASGWDGSRPYAGEDAGRRKDGSGHGDGSDDGRGLGGDGVDFELVQHQFARSQMLDALISRANELRDKHDQALDMHQAQIDDAHFSAPIAPGELFDRDHNHHERIDRERHDDHYRLGNALPRAAERNHGDRILKNLTLIREASFKVHAADDGAVSEDVRHHRESLAYQLLVAGHREWQLD